MSKERLLRDIESWQTAIKAEGEPTPEAVNVFDWYWNEVRKRSYHAKNWCVPPDRSALFRQFREDPYYHLKNLVEIVARGLVEEMLRADGLDARVMVTSDSDDVFAGVDYVVETRTPEGTKEYSGIDLAISDNPKYIKQKEIESSTVCREFNRFMGWGKTPNGEEPAMHRYVFALPPKVMAGFLPSYMKLVAAGHRPNSKETLELFEAAKIRITASNIRTAATTVASTKSAVSHALH